MQCRLWHRIKTFVGKEILKRSQTLIIYDTKCHIIMKMTPEIHQRCNSVYDTSITNTHRKYT